MKVYYANHPPFALRGARCGGVFFGLGGAIRSTGCGLFRNGRREILNVVFCNPVYSQVREGLCKIRAGRASTQTFFLQNELAQPAEILAPGRKQFQSRPRPASKRSNGAPARDREPDGCGTCRPGFRFWRVRKGPIHVTVACLSPISRRRERKKPRRRHAA